MTTAAEQDGWRELLSLLLSSSLEEDHVQTSALCRTFLDTYTAAGGAETARARLTEESELRISGSNRKAGGELEDRDQSSAGVFQLERGATLNIAPEIGSGLATPLA